MYVLIRYICPRTAGMTAARARGKGWGAVKNTFAENIQQFVKKVPVITIF